jgi:hypothetical protein
LADPKTSSLSRCPRHEDSLKKKLKEKSKFNCQTRKNARLCDSKIKT